MEPQANIAVAPDTYAQMGTASDGSTISYPDGLDIVSDIYENHYSFDIRHDLWITETEIKEFDEETGWWHSV